MPAFVEPAYGVRSLGDLLPAVGTAMGVRSDLPPVDWGLPPASAYVVVLVDGMGYRQLAEHRSQAPYLHSLLGGAWAQQPLTAGVPSTTATSLTSLGTALTPGRHGVVGFTSRVPETGALLNALFWDQPVDPLAWQPHPTAFDRLEAAGVATTVVSKAEFAGSGLTRCALRGARFVGADDVTERIAGAVDAVAAAGSRPSVTYVYDNALDWHGHRAGVDSSRWRHQLRDIDEDVQELREELPDDVRVVVVADHGMVDTTPETSLDLDTLPGIRDGVLLLGGEARFRQVWCHSGALDDVAATWTALLGDRASVLRREEALDRGWFGGIDGQVRARIGELVVAAHGTWALFSSQDFEFETSLIGLHGSLTPGEMEIPLLVC
jgi:hypothetical protein